MFRTLQGRLVNELALAGITQMAQANAFLKDYWPRFNASFTAPARESGSAFVPLLEIGLDDILCLQEARTVQADNCVRYRGMTLQIPAQAHRCHYVKAKVRVHEYPDGSLSIFHGPRRLARYNVTGQLFNPGQEEKVAA